MRNIYIGERHFRQSKEFMGNGEESDHEMGDFIFFYPEAAFEKDVRVHCLQLCDFKSKRQPQRDHSWDHYFALITNNLYIYVILTYQLITHIKLIT